MSDERIGRVFTDPDTGIECTVVWHAGLSVDPLRGRSEPYGRQTRSTLIDLGFDRADPDLSSYRPKSRVRI